MTRTLDDELTTYLRSEADRLEVHDTLADIQDDVVFVPLAASPQRNSQLLVVCAAATLILVFLGLALDRRAQPQDAPAAAQPDATSPVTVVATSTSPSTTVLVVPAPLPGGAVLQGLTPSCTTPDNVEFNCTIPAYPDIVLIDMTGYSTIVVDDTSHVSGGCRATTPDALSWTCYLGQVAVDKGFVSANSLGDWAPREYAAG